MNEKLPTKLGKEPLIDVVFEMRFQSNVSVMDVLPGLFYANCDGEKEFKRNNIAEIPKLVRDGDHNLRHAVLTRLVSGDYAYGVGDRVFNISCKLPYKGWEEFKAAITWSLDLINSSGVVQHMERFALKYVDLLEADNLQDQISLININLDLAGIQLKDQSFNIRVDLPEGNVVHIVSLVPQAEVLMKNQQFPKRGVVVDVDSLVHAGDWGADEWYDNLKNELDQVHLKNKRMFFKCLREDVVESLEPTYE